MIFADLKHLSSKIVRVRDHENWNSLVNKVEEEQRTTMKKKIKIYVFKHYKFFEKKYSMGIIVD